MNKYYDHLPTMIQTGEGWNDTNKYCFNKKRIPEGKAKNATVTELEEGVLVSKTLQSLTLTQETEEY